ncbi:Ribosomal protein L23 [Chlamydia trachomatis]|nr:Ribosomal protein L23 [Chlamydia trachomatis]
MENSSTNNPKAGPTPTLKVVLLGDLGVGKTCLRSQFVHHVFTNAYKATIGGDYLTTSVVLPQQIQQSQLSSSTSSLDIKSNFATTRLPSTNTKVNLQIWDTAGQERFNSISQAFYRGTDVCVLVYDVTNYESVLSIRDWFNRFMEHCHVEFPGIVIVGNKSDKSTDRCVDLNEIKDIVTTNTTFANVGDYIDDWDNSLMEISAKRLELVEELFVRVAKIGVDLLMGNKGDNKRRLQQFDKIDLRETHNRINDNTTSTSSSCAC